MFRPAHWPHHAQCIGISRVRPAPIRIRSATIITGGALTAVNAGPFRVLRYPKIAHAAASTAIPVRCSVSEGRFLGSRGGKSNRDLGRRGGSRTLTFPNSCCPRASLTRERFLARTPCAFVRSGTLLELMWDNSTKPGLHRAFLRDASVRRPVSADLIGKLCVVGRPDDRVLIKKIRQGSKPGLYLDFGGRAGNQRRFTRLGCQRQKHGAAMNWRVALVILAALGAAVSVFVTWPWSDAAWWGITIIACIALVGLIYDDDQRRSANRDAENSPGNSSLARTHRRHPCGKFVRDGTSERADLYIRHVMSPTAKD